MLAGNVLLLHELSEHIFDQAKLDAPGANREIDCTEDQHEHQKIGVHHGIDVACDIDKGRHEAVAHV